MRLVGFTRERLSATQPLAKRGVPNFTFMQFCLFPFSEICLTSNVKGRTVASFKDHHLGFWKANNHPVIICVSHTSRKTMTA